MERMQGHPLANFYHRNSLQKKKNEKRNSVRELRSRGGVASFAAKKVGSSFALLGKSGMEGRVGNAVGARIWRAAGRS